MVRTCLLLTALWFLGVAMLVAAPVGAQTTISGTLVEAGTGTPLKGATVTLLDRSGELVAWRRTDAAGRFGFGRIRPGTYTLRTDRIGHASIRSDPFTVERGATVLRRLETPVEAIILAGIDVESSRRCEVRPGQGAATATVWEEARKALEATSRTSESGIYRYMTRRYERELDNRARRVRSEQSRILRGQVLVTPFRSLAVENLLENGFVRPDGNGIIWYAPDADVLLSDAFLDTHCMSLSEGKDEAEGLLGLSFQPTEDRGVLDISGVLWLDPADAELQWLDYQYEFLDVPNSERLGGKIRFSGLPDGTWIVREWYIRMPILGTERSDLMRRTGRRMQNRLVGIREEGGLVVRVNNLQGDLVLDSRAGIIEGMVLDYERSAPVEGVVVLLDDSTRVKTDDDGRFRFTDLVEGYYGLRAVDPVLDSLGLSADPVFFEARPGDVTSANLRFRSLDAAMTDRCAAYFATLGAEDRDAASEYEGILTGLVLDHKGEAAIGARIRVEWEEIFEIISGTESFIHTVTTSEISGNGVFLACGLPRDTAEDWPLGWDAENRSVDITVEWNGIETPPAQVHLSASRRVTRRDVTVPEGR